ncbi:hypothetical protein Hanom_Chr07g00591881 [Helianthus anomalus]
MSNSGTKMVIGELKDKDGVCYDESLYAQCDGTICANDCKQKKGSDAHGRCLPYNDCLCEYLCKDKSS